MRVMGHGMVADLSIFVSVSLPISVSVFASCVFKLRTDDDDKGKKWAMGVSPMPDNARSLNCHNVGCIMMLLLSPHSLPSHQIKNLTQQKKKWKKNARNFYKKFYLLLLLFLFTQRLFTWARRKLCFKINSRHWNGASFSFFSFSSFFFSPLLISFSPVAFPFNGCPFRTANAHLMSV